MLINFEKEIKKILQDQGKRLEACEKWTKEAKQIFSALSESDRVKATYHLWCWEWETEILGEYVDGAKAYAFWSYFKYEVGIYKLRKYRSMEVQEKTKAEFLEEIFEEVINKLLN